MTSDLPHLSTGRVGEQRRSAQRQRHEHEAVGAEYRSVPDEVGRAATQRAGHQDKQLGDVPQARSECSASQTFVVPDMDGQLG